MSTQVAKNTHATLITGATSGIGLELARVLAANGHALAIVARDSERLKTVAADLGLEYHVPVTALDAGGAALGIH